MKKLVGGLFKTQQQANLAYEAFQKSGFSDEEINMFIHKPHDKTARSMGVRIQDIAINALFGGLIAGVTGGFLGFLVGSGIVHLPGLEPGTVELNGAFLTNSIASGVVLAGLTGIILGVAAKLLRSREKAEVMTRQIDKRGVLVTVSVDDSKSEKKARQVLKTHGALEVGNPSEKWDMEAWASPNETSPSLKKAANTN